ncbi:putative 4-hydroxybenzoate polyprenyltransferase [Desulfobacterota bacterium AH_259_B03_O07]|nr:putative 4-hydroxybenzoate polyprenyltransferase [Desulfobacterota bacterium AH_259_B03_O07]
MEKLRLYASFIKLEHTLFSLPLIFAGSFLAANGVPSLRAIVLIILAGAGARTAALALNRIIDREIDQRNPRTEDRELPSGKITLTGALTLTVFGILGYLISAYLICDLVFYLSPIPLIVFVLYPYMKRFTPLCHFGVGLGLSLAPLGGWVAVTCSLSNLLLPILLSLFTLFWVSGFDIIYATLDQQFDKKEGIYSLVSAYGKNQALLISAVLHILAFYMLVSIYFLNFNSLLAVAFLLISGFLLYLEYKKSSDVDVAFFKINIIVGFVVFLFVISSIYLP